MVPRPLPRNGVQPLLSMVGGKPRDGTTAKPVKEPDDVFALPVESSDDEAEEQPLRDVFVDSSDDDRLSRRADIVPTKFGAKAASKKTAANNGRQGSPKGKKPASESLDLTPKRRSARQPAILNATKKRSLEDIEDDESEHASSHASNKKTKTPAKKPVTAVGDHMQPGWLLESSIERKAKSQKAGYGKKAGKSRNLTPTENFKSYKVDSSTPEKASPFKTIHFKSDDKSPVPDLKLPKQSRKKKKSQSASELSELPLEASQQPELKLPEGYDDYAPNADLVGFDMSLNETPASEKRVLEPGLRLCPMCDEEVDEKSLEAFSKGQRMTIARQTKFCRMHKEESAQRVWETKGYPDIDWQNLVKRVAEHRDLIESLIRGASSHFGTLHEEKIKSGKNRTIFKTEEYPTPGYYGMRGMSIMTETLVEMFSSLLRERAPIDKLISARGYTAYVQSVLVPELAVKLIQEDMGDVDADEARSIMEKSRAVGELLNDEKSEPRPKRNTRGQATKKKGGAPHSDDASDERAAAKNGKKAPKMPIDLGIQAIVDSDSELSSLDSESMGDGSTIEARVLGKTQAVEEEDSDSDLTSLGDF